MPAASQAADEERRFGGLRRLYGDVGYGRIRAASVAVIGVGGVGSWAAEALARSGVARLTLIDLDHVSESNINRQVQALGGTLGKAKVEALSERIADIHPACIVDAIDAFVDADNWPALLREPVDAVIDACDDARAKTVIAAWSVTVRAPLIVVGAAGGKRMAERVEVADLADATHDPLLAALRQRLRKKEVVSRSGRTGIDCVFSREPVALPAIEAGATGEQDRAPGGDEAVAVDGTLNCHGYGSTVAVTATFGMVAAGRTLDRLASGAMRSAGSAPL